MNGSGENVWKDCLNCIGNGRVEMEKDEDIREWNGD